MLGLALIAFLGCVTRDNFPEKFALTTCQKEKECEPDTFDALFEDMDGCVDFFEPFVGSIGEECEFDAAEASQCLGSIRSASCDDPEFSCEEIYECGA